MNKGALLALGFCALLVTPLSAATLKLPKDYAAISITTPDSWSVADHTDGYTCESPDHAAHMLFELIPSEKVKDHVGETMDWLVMNRRLEIDKSTLTKSGFTDGTLDWKTTKWDGKNEAGQPATIMLAFADAGNGKTLMITYWVTKASESTLQTDITEILGSVQKAAL